MGPSTRLLEVCPVNPLATITMQNGKKIEIELLPAIACNEVSSFIWAANKGYYDHHTIERIVPGAWIDMSYTAFHREECKYFLPNRLSEKNNVPIPQEGGSLFRVLLPD